MRVILISWRWRRFRGRWRHCGIDLRDGQLWRLSWFYLQRRQNRMEFLWRLPGLHLCFRERRWRRPRHNLAFKCRGRSPCIDRQRGFRRRPDLCFALEGLGWGPGLAHVRLLGKDSQAYKTKNKEHQHRQFSNHLILNRLFALPYQKRKASSAAGP